jgi:DNA polymerase (family 10)
MDNTTIARKLLDHALSLESHGHSLYRVRAYRRAAGVIQRLPVALSELFEEGGREALEGLPGVGAHLAYTLEKLIREGEIRTLGPKPHETNPRERVIGLAGVGTRALERMQGAGITTVEEVEAASVEGTLQEIGLSERRIDGIQTALAARRRERLTEVAVAHEPAISNLLAVDADYRELAASQENRSEGSPILTIHRDGWTLQATFSASPLAFRLGQSHDWVVIHFSNGLETGERIIVTETRPPLCGQRVVRGREHECHACWAS